MSIFLLRILQLFFLNRLTFVADPEFYLYPYLVSRGLIPYRQIVDQHFPGLFFGPVNFFSLGFSSPEAFKALLWFLVIIQSVLVYKISRKYFDRLAAVRSVAIFSLWQPLFDGHHLWIDTFIAVLALPALYFWLDKKYLRTGLFLGLALLFKQTIIFPIIFLGIYLFFKDRKNFLKLVSFPILISLQLFFYYWSQNSLRDFFYWTIKFNLTSYSQSAAGSPDFPKWLILFTFLCLTAIFMQWKNIRLRWLSLWAGLFLLGSLTRPDLVHFHSVIPFLFIILGYSLARLPRLGLLICGTFLILFPVYKIFSKQSSGDYRYFDPSTLAAAQYLKQNTYPGQEIFILGAQPHLYALSGTVPAGRYYSYQLPWYLSVTQAKILATLRQSPPRYIVFDSTAAVDNHSIYSYAPQLIKYLETHYRYTVSFGSLQIFTP